MHAPKQQKTEGARPSQNQVPKKPIVQTKKVNNTGLEAVARPIPGGGMAVFGGMGKIPTKPKEAGSSERSEEETGPVQVENSVAKTQPMEAAQKPVPNTPKVDVSPAESVPENEPELVEQQEEEIETVTSETMEAQPEAEPSPPPEDRSSWKQLSLWNIVTTKLGLDYNAVIAAFREENGRHADFYSWVKKSIVEFGWTQLSDPVPNIHEIKVTWKEENDRGVMTQIPYIEAYSFSDAFAHAGKLGLARNAGEPFYWVTKISNTARKYRYNFSSSAAYKNYLAAKSIKERRGAIPADYVQEGFFHDLKMMTGAEAEIDALLAKAWTDRYLSDTLIDLVAAAQEIQLAEYRVEYVRLKNTLKPSDLAKFDDPDTLEVTGLIDWGFMYWLMNYEMNKALNRERVINQRQEMEKEGIRTPDGIYDLPEFLTEADHDFVYGHNVGSRVGKAGIAARHKFKIKYTPTPRNTDRGVEGYKSFLILNERLFVLRKYEGWYFIATQDGVTGWVESYAIAFNPPEPNAEIYQVESGDNLWNIAKKKYGLSSSVNKRLYINAIIYANFRAKRAGNINFTGSPGMFELGDPYHYDPELIAGTSIWIPSKKFVKKLEEAGVISSGSLVDAFWDVLEAIWDSLVAAAAFVWEVIQGVAGFISGVIMGILESIWDLIKGVFEMAYSIVEGIVNTIIDAFTGELYRKAERLFHAVKNLTWADVEAFLEEIEKSFDQWMSDLDAKWNAPNTFDRWYNRGHIIGYVIAEIILTIVSFGGAAAVKWGSRAFKYLGKLGKILEEILGVVTKRHKVDRMLPDEVVPDKKKNVPDKKKPDPDLKEPQKGTGTQSEVDDLAKKDKNDPVEEGIKDSEPNASSKKKAMNLAEGIVTTGDEGNRHPSEIMPSLWALTVYKGVRGFSYTSLGGNTFDIFMHGSKKRIKPKDGKYDVSKKSTFDIDKIPQNGKVIHQLLKKGIEKKDIVFKNRNDAMNWAREKLGHNTTKMHDSSGKLIGWKSDVGEVYWGHGDWGKGVGSSTYPHLNYNFGDSKGHLFLGDKIKNRGQLESFVNYFNL